MDTTTCLRYAYCAAHSLRSARILLIAGLVRAGEVLESVVPRSSGRVPGVYRRRPSSGRLAGRLANPKSRVREVRVLVAGAAGAVRLARRPLNASKNINGAYRDRTDDLLVANQALSQLS